MTKGTIGMNAGTIWNIMADVEESPMSFGALKEMTALSDADLWTAIGWLARENKIEINTEAGQLVCFNVGRNFYY
ncbi:winged helix-turn-helix domain-containing protein [Parabacteroides sp. OttesenSCG-928-N08]|nr:winged helix-turn-helix domain-containing protein [Parabacteroides sp. OttesenSCG-928-N08]